MILCDQPDCDASQDLELTDDLPLSTTDDAIGPGKGVLLRLPGPQRSEDTRRRPGAARPLI
jgi:hypothetical protein